MKLFVSLSVCLTVGLTVCLSVLQQSLAEGQQLRLKTLSSPTPEGAAAGGVGGGSSSKASSSCDVDDFVIVPAIFAGEIADISSNFVAILLLLPTQVPFTAFCPGGELMSDSKVLQDSLMASR